MTSVAAVRRVAFATLGCKVNQYDTEQMLTLFRRSGYQVVAFDEPADIYVINTCTVTGRGAAKSRQLIRNAIRRSPFSVVAVAGCYPQTSPGEVAAIPGVSVVIGTQDRDRIVELCEAAAGQEAPIRAVNNVWLAREFEDIPIATFFHGTRAVVKVQDGCNVFCTFCIIPYARGKPRSREPQSVLAEVEQLAGQGYREVVLTGIHVGSYGKDVQYRFTLEGLVEQVAAVPGIDRVRLSSIEPGHVTDRLVELMASHPRICRHLHLSLQSGAEGVLRRMKRAYTADEFRRKVEKIKALMPDCGLTTDVIVGFPGETEAEHRESLAFVREMGFSRLHVFPFSPRTGTPAATMAGQVPRPVREQRTHEMIALGDDLARQFHRRFLGQTLAVLAEEEAETEAGWLEGYTQNYIRVRFPAGDELRNTLIPVRLTHATPEICQGEMDGQPVGSTRSGEGPRAADPIWLPLVEHP